VSTRQRFHSERAAHFKQHASNTKNPDTREMYLRLAEVEMVLAAKEVEPAKELSNKPPDRRKSQESPSGRTTLRVPALAGACSLARSPMASGTIIRGS
jgi:hypothetical protein